MRYLPRKYNTTIHFQIRSEIKIGKKVCIFKHKYNKKESKVKQIYLVLYKTKRNIFFLKKKKDIMK